MQSRSPWGNDSNQPTNQQTTYVQAPAFKPSPNYRHISYIVIANGIGLSILLSMMAEISGLDLFLLPNSICCGSLGIACIVDAMYYNDKSNWQQQTGADTTSTTIGMVTDIIFAIICLGLAFLFLLGF